MSEILTPRVYFVAFAKDVQKGWFFMKIDLFKSINRQKIDRAKNLKIVYAKIDQSMFQCFFTSLIYCKAQISKAEGSHSNLLRLIYWSSGTYGTHATWPKNIFQSLLAKSDIELDQMELDYVLEKIDIYAESTI